MSQVQQVRSASEILASFGISQETVVKLPTGGFTGGGFIGPLVAAHLYSVGVQGDEVLEDSGAVTTESRGGYVWYYFLDQAVGDKFDVENGGQYKRANPVHRIEMATRNLVAPENIVAERIEQFGEIINGQVRRLTFASKKYRHEWQLIGLPALVHAAAVWLGHDVPEFDIDDLRNQDTSFTDELFERLCGDPTAKTSEESYTSSVYYQQRAKLWAVLGEEDPTKCHTTEEGTSFSTASKKLSSCLMLASSNWTQPIYGRLRLIADPRPEAVSGSGNRISLGIVTDLYANEVQAKEAAGSDDEGSTSAAPAPAGPAVPDEYTTLDNALAIWTGEVERTKAMPPAVAAGQVGVDVSHVLVWREHLGL